MNENNTAIKDARSLGLPKMLLLGLQHMFAMFGATILVPILVNTYFEGQGLSIQVTLMCAGLGTLFFHACSKFKVPAFLGSSFAFLGGFATVANLNIGIFADMTMGEKLPYACGGIVVAGALYLILALIIKLAGVEQANIVKLARELFDDKDAYAKMAHAVNPYGDGKTSQRIVQAIEQYFGLREDGPAPFNP